MYGNFHIEKLRERNHLDPEGEVRLANEVLACIEDLAHQDFEKAEALLAEITDPIIRQGIEENIEFFRTCLCLKQASIAVSKGQ